VIPRVREVLEQIGARHDADRLAAVCDDDRVHAAGQCRHDLVHRLVCVDRRQWALHRDGDVLVQRVGVLEDEVEQCTILQRADHVAE